MSAVLAVDSVGRSFGTRRVLHAASLHVVAGSVTALLGRNGCGKTTLINIVNGFLRADHGAVFFLGSRQHPPRLHRMARQGLFFLPERHLLSRGRSAGDHIDALLRRFPNVDAPRIMAAMDITSLLERTPEQLSTGEIRRIEMALVFLRRPVCLVADEPFMGLAPRDAEHLAHAIRALAADGAGILLTGHEIQNVLDVADSIVWMTSGTTHFLGSRDEAVRHDQFRREYLGTRQYRPAALQSPHGAERP
jgi:ABC-type lipopolysaccharide export system ATPase subunit